MCPFPCLAIPIGLDHSRQVELILLIIPTKCHRHIRRMFIVDPGYIQPESSFNLVTGKNHASKIGLLQELDEASCDRRIVLNDVKQDSAAVSREHDVSRLCIR